MRWLALVWTVAFAGCALEAAPPTVSPSPVAYTVDPPADGGGFALCPPRSSVPEAVPFRAEATSDAAGRGLGLHRLDAKTLLYVWATYNDTLRMDRVSRVNEVQVARDANGTRHICTRVDIVAPTSVDGVHRTYDVAVRMESSAFPTGAVHVVVNWVAGCRCDVPPQGNATLDLPGPSPAVP